MVPPPLRIHRAREMFDFQMGDKYVYGERTLNDRFSLFYFRRFVREWFLLIEYPAMAAGIGVVRRNNTRILIAIIRLYFVDIK